MFNLKNVIGAIFNSKGYVEIDVENLPSRGIFYKDDFKIKVKPAEQIDIDKYNSRYIDGNFVSIIGCIKLVIIDNIKLSENYSFNNLSSIDILYIFLEIVKITKNDYIYIKHNGIRTKFCSENFNYFNIKEDLIKFFDAENKEFVYDGFKYSLPTVGVETSITRFLYDMSSENRLDNFSESSYDFLYFLGGKIRLTNDEIENLITIFNEELSYKDKETISAIVEKFKPFSKYSLKTSNGVVPLDGINLKHIWEN